MIKTRAECEQKGGIWDERFGPSHCLKPTPHYVSDEAMARYDELHRDDPDRRYYAERDEERRLGYTGLSPDSPIVTNEQGGMQSQVEGRFDLIPAVAMFELANVMAHGAEKYAPNNWRKIDVDSHLNHLLQHVFAYLAGDRQESHLSHALARAAMAVELEEEARRGHAT